MLTAVSPIIARNWKHLSTGEHTVVYPYNEILLSSKKEWLTDPFNIVDEPLKHYERDQIQKAIYYGLYILYRFSIYYILYYIDFLYYTDFLEKETEKRSVVVKGLRMGEVGSL